MSLELRSELTPGILQTINLMLNPRMLQMLKMLNLPYQELIEKINAEIESNVMLEIEKPDELLEYIRSLAFPRAAKKEIFPEEIPGIENLKDSARSLSECLLKQLELESLSEIEKGVGEYLILCLDSHGYLLSFPEVKKAACKEFKASPSLVEKVLKIIQTFEPEGVGARDLKECLLIQLREYNFSDKRLQKILEKVVEKHLDDLGAGNYSKVAQALKIEEEGVVSLLNFIKNNLNPSPGSFFVKEAPPIIPSFVIEKKKEGYQAINLEARYGPILKLNPTYLKMLEDPKTDRAALEFLKNKMNAAKTLMETILRRAQMMERIMEMVALDQTGFFEKGAASLRPLMQKEIAEKLGVHPSTISRAIAGKYVLTPNGVFSLKFLCPREYRGYAPERIKNLIYTLINSENKQNPLSDEELRKMLEKEGVKTCRRTITAYRKELKIPPFKKRSKLAKPA